MKLFHRLKQKSDRNEPVLVEIIQTKPRKFWGYCKNEAFQVCCNGATVYIYDNEFHLLAQFKDVPYAYRAKFVPDTNRLVVKSTAGYLAVYDLDTLSLRKKIKVSAIGAQDEGFAFTVDGKYLYNIEKPLSSLHTQITVYETGDFQAVKTMFKNDHQINVKALEFDTDNRCFVLGFVRNEEGIYDYGFIGKLDAKGIKDIKKLEKDEFDYIRDFKRWEDFGFTQKSKENAYCLKDKEAIEYVSLKRIASNEIRGVLGF